MEEEYNDMGDLLSLASSIVATVYIEKNIALVDEL